MSLFPKPLTCMREHQVHPDCILSRAESVVASGPLSVVSLVTLGGNLETATEIFGLKSKVKVWRKLAGNWDRKLMGTAAYLDLVGSMVRVTYIKRCYVMTENECKEKVYPN